MKDKSSYPMNVRERSETGHAASAEGRRMKNVRKEKAPQAVAGRKNARAKVLKPGDRPRSYGFSFGSI